MTALESGIEEHFLSELDMDTSDVQTQRFLCGYNQTDMGNAQRLIGLYGEDIRYCAERGAWNIWAGIRWAPDTTKFIQELAKKTVRLIHAEAAQLALEDATKEDRQKLSAWAFKSEEQRRINAMIKNAESDPRVAVKASDFDANPWLINCPNGTLDLERREFREHRRGDLLTKVTGAPYNPSQSSELFYPTLLRAVPLVEAMYSQRMLGSFLEPTTQNKEWLFIYGLPFALKSSCTQPVYGALGDYAQSFPIELLIKSQHGRHASQAQPELIALEGVRIAWSEEAPPNFVIDEPMLKSLTSSGIKAARQVYEKQKQLKLVCSFVIESNGTFTFDIDDEWSRDAALERTRVMKFVNQIPENERDPEVLKRITSDEAELTAALAWAVQGYFDRRDFGLETPESIKETSEEFEVAINPLSSFIKNEIEFTDGTDGDYEISVFVRDLWQRFQETTSAEVLKSFKGSRSFNIQLRRVIPYYAKIAGVEGVRPDRVTGGTIWRNMRLINREDYAEALEGTPNKDSMKQTGVYEANGLFGVKSSCAAEYYTTLHQNGVLLHRPTFPTILVNGLEPVELDFSTIAERSDEIKSYEDKSSKPPKTTADERPELMECEPLEAGCDRTNTVVSTKHDLNELAQLIRGTLIAAKDAGHSIGRVADELGKERLAEATVLTVKRQHPKWRDYDVLSFFKKLEENEKEIQGLIADLTEKQPKYDP